MSAEQRLKERGIILPELPSPKGTYVPATQHNGILYLSGQGPLLENGEFACGVVGRDFTVEQAYQHARRTGLVLLSAARAALGSLDKVERVLNVLGMVNAVPGFGEHPKVINGLLRPAGRGVRRSGSPRARRRWHGNPADQHLGGDHRHHGGSPLR